MAWFKLLWKAIKFKLALRRLKIAKRNAYRQSLGLSPIYPLYQRPFRWVGGKLKLIALKTCCRCCKRKPGSGVSNWDKLWTNGTLQNELLKGFVGLIAGITFTILLRNFLTAQLSFNPTIVSVICITIGSLLTIGLTFSDTIRCLFSLAIPQFFNKKGRAAILAYAMIIALSGPGKNTALNMEILTESLVCGQDMVRDSTRDLVELATNPFSVLKNAIKVIITSIQDVLERMSNELKGVIKTIYEIVNVIKQAYTFLRSIVNMCNKKLGSPYDRCLSSFTTASNDCAEKLGPAGSWLCSTVDLFQNFCYFAKIVDVFCWLPSLVKQAIFEPLKEHFQIFANGFKEFFDVRLNITYKFDHELIQDKTLGDIVRSMKGEILERVEWFFKYVDWMDLVVSFLMLLVVWKVFTYWYKFKSCDSFDNYYITRNIIRMDLDRQGLGRESIFPLRYRETQLYVETFSWNLVEDEQKERKLSLLLVGLAGIQILNYVLMDYLLFLFLELIRKHGSIQINTREALGLAVTVEGEGFLASMYRSILDGLSPVGGVLPSFDTSKCLPNASKPNYHQYFLILFLLFLCVTVAIMEPYGLRLRHKICGWVYPERIIARERWLYTHMLSSRDSFLVFARRQIQAKLKGDNSIYRVSIMDRFAHTLPFCRGLFISHKKKCFLCGQTGDLDDHEFFVECPNCQTVYCKECFNDMEKKCTACLNPIDYGDLTDVDEELGSDSETESEPDIFAKCTERLCRRRKELKSQKSNTPRKSKEKQNNSVGKPQKSKEGAQTKLNKSPLNENKSQVKTKLKSGFGKNVIQGSSTTKSHQSGWLSKVFGNFGSQFLSTAKSYSTSLSKSKINPTKPKSSKKLTKKNFKGNQYQALASSSDDERNVTKGKYSKIQNTSQKQKSAGRSAKSSSPIPPVRKSPHSSKKGYTTIPQIDSDEEFGKKYLRNTQTSKIEQNLNPFQSPATKSKLKAKTAFKSNSSQIRNESRVDEKTQKKSPRYQKSPTPSNRYKDPMQNQITNQPKQPERKSTRNQSHPSNVSQKESVVNSARSHSRRPREKVTKNKSTYEEDNNLINLDYESCLNATADGYSSSSTFYIEEIDGQDVDGVCHHHQSVEPKFIQKYDNVLSEMNMVYAEEMAGGCDEFYNQESFMGESNNDNSGCRGCEEISFLPHHPEMPMCPKNSWWCRNSHTLQNEQFRKPPQKISSKLKDRVNAYNEFYAKMPYPPHCNL